jgi:hypothetical protein
LPWVTGRPWICPWNAQTKNRKLISDLYKNESRYTVQQNEKCAKLWSLCCEQLLKILRRKLVTYFMDRCTNTQEVDIGFVQKLIPPYGMPKQCAKISSLCYE